MVSIHHTTERLQSISSTVQEHPYPKHNLYFCFFIFFSQVFCLVLYSWLILLDTITVHSRWIITSFFLIKNLSILNYIDEKKKRLTQHKVQQFLSSDNPDYTHNTKAVAHLSVLNCSNTDEKKNTYM
jgi:hypothetical protein